MSNVIPINSRAIAAAAIRAKLHEAANASSRLGSLEDTIDLIRYECDRFAWLAPPAEKGKSRKLDVFALHKRYREFEFTPLRHRVPSLRILRPNRRNSPRLRPHLRDARHRRKPLSGGSCARRGQSLCWQVRRFHPCPTHDGIDSTTGLAEM